MVSDPQGQSRTRAKNWRWLPLLYLVIVTLPYLSRLVYGVEWLRHYLPDRDHLWSGFLFFIVFNSLPFIPVAVTHLLRRRLPVTAMFCLGVTVVLLVFFHYDYDMTADAQAAVGLVIIPLFVTVGATTIGLLGGVAEWLITSWLHHRQERTDDSA